MSAGQVASAIAAVAIVGWIAFRRGALGRERIVIGAIVAALLAAYAAGAFGHLPSFEKIIEHLANALGVWTYVLVGVMAFLETGAFVGLVAPGEFTVLVGGVIAGRGTIDVILLLGIVWACCIAGDSTSFFVGRRLGRSFLERHGPKVKITKERLAQVDGFFERHGGRTILIGRFIGLVRAVAPFVAGSSGMAYRSFIPYSVLGTGLWAATYTLLGYFFYQSFEKVAGIAGKVTLAFGVAVAVVLAARTGYRRREELAAWIRSKPALAPILDRGIEPAWRFVRDHLTLELVSALAVAAAGLFVFLAYAIEVAGRHRITPGDHLLHSAAGSLYSHTVEEVVEVVTALGALPVTGGLALLTAAFLAYRRRGVELAVVVIGFLIVFAAVQITKGAVDRPRPPDPLTGSSGKSYPSGHSAYATIYVVVAVIAAAMFGGIAKRTALVAGAVALGALIGFTRIYLRVHWWSDVAGGWALGLGTFASVLAATVVVERIRNNEAPHARDRE